MIDEENNDETAQQIEKVEASFQEEDPQLVSDDGTTSDDMMSLHSPEMAAKFQLMHESMSLESQIEAALFASPTPLKPEDLLPLVSHRVSLQEISSAVESIATQYDEKKRGFGLVHLKGQGYQFQSHPLAAPIMARMFASHPRPLSRAALETLAIIAYRQPCTRAAIEFVRGVDAGSIIKNLLDRNLIKCVGRREDAGRPMLFGTTDEFLHIFGIGSLKDLPPLSSFQPSSDTLKESLAELERIDQVNPDEFVKDASEDAPEFGEGLLVGVDGENLSLEEP